MLGPNTSLVTMFAVGYLTTLAAGTVSYPLDTIRARMMMRSCEKVKYKGWINCGWQIVKNEGFMMLMKGYGVNLIKSVLNTVILIGIDSVKPFRKRSGGDDGT